MSVKLVGLTHPVIPEVSTPEEFISYCARVSNPNNQLNHMTASKLLKWLIDHKHWSPFEIVSLTMEIQTTRDIGRQILRHRSFSFQEFSQRYSDEIQFTNRECRLQDSKNRQNSIDNADDELNSWFLSAQSDIKNWASHYYEEAINRGIAKEQARCLLSEGLTLSNMYMAGTLRSWIHYCQLRRDNGTQKEHKLIAEQCWNIILQQFPSLKGLITID
jgi:thymidylate synthase (FAD)